MKQKLTAELNEFKLLLRAIPSFVTVLFVLSVFSMNLLANKSLSLPVSWLALDCGIIVSWFSFLSMDVITKHFGPKAATEVSLFAICVNLIMCLIFALGAVLPGVWGESFVDGSESIINNAINATFGGTWYVLAGSSVAFAVSSVVNNFLNRQIGRIFKKSPDGFVAYAARSYFSTAIGQFTDNIIFALAVSHVFFGWSLIQCFTCAVTGMAAELLFEVVFSWLGFYICRKWKAEGVGKEYFMLKGGENI